MPPLKYTAEQFAKGVDEYFESISKMQLKEEKEPDPNKKENWYKEWLKPPLITGICVYLEIDRDTFANYGKRDTHFGTYKKAKQICEQYAEEYLFTGKNTAGAIFNLCNNYSKSWKQTNHIDHTSKDKELSVLTSILQDIDGDTSSIGMIEEQEPLPIECDSLE